MSSSPQTRIRYFRHGNIAKYSQRPFLDNDEQALLDSGDINFKVSIESIKRMDDALIEGINKTVGENDTLWHLGDFCFASKNEYYQKARELRERINCKHVNIIWGNHDNRVIADLFENNFDLHSIRIGKQLVVLCHYAMAIWDRSHHGSWHLYGHSHSCAENRLDQLFPGRRSMDVGVDNAYKILGEYRPFAFDEIQTCLQKMEEQPVRN